MQRPLMGPSLRCAYHPDLTTRRTRSLAARAGFALLAAVLVTDAVAQEKLSEAQDDAPAAQSTPEPIYRANSPFVSPGVTFARVDWRAALEQLRGEIAAEGGTEGFLSNPRRRWRPPFSRNVTSLTQINALTSAHFPGIATSPIPVLLPFDNGLLVFDRMREAAEPADFARYSTEFPKLEMMAAGAAGYSAAYTVPPGKSDHLPSRVFSRPIEVQITGSLVTYNVVDPIGGRGESVASLAQQYPDIRRFIREGYVRYAFTRFGVAYVVSMQCRDIGPRSRVLSCREASPIAERFLKSLRVVGGRPGKTPRNRPATSVGRPRAVHDAFTFLPPGNIVPNTGYRRSNGGFTDYNAYAQIRFPLERAPAFANSQSFANWRDCSSAGRSPASDSKELVYRCRVKGGPPVFYEKASGTHTYPWRDNYCEARDFQAGQCPAGMGHQGQDIRPTKCDIGDVSCAANLHRVVAARDGVIVRRPKQEAAFLLINEPTEHIRFRYLHMNPSRLDEDGVVYGRRMHEGEAFGLVSNYQDYVGGTSLHLHFDIQVFTRDGWIWVNPYATLISAYERLLGARGREILPPPSAAPEISSPTTDTPRRAADASGVTKGTQAR